MVNYYDLDRGEKINTYTMSADYGINTIRFTNHNKTVLVATRKDNVYSILYWSLHDNIILARFSGHMSRIVSIEVNPLCSTFVSTANDEETRIWDYDKVDSVALFTECQSACIDNTGKVLACSHCPKNSEEKHIYLYNMEEEMFDKPFSNLLIGDKKNSNLSFMKFSYDGKFILCIDSLNQVLIIDAFVGGIIIKLEDFTDSMSSPLIADFTPCSQYVVIAMNKKVVFWDWSNNKEITLQQHHVKHINAIRFNTEY